MYCNAMQCNAMQYNTIQYNVLLIINEIFNFIYESSVPGAMMPGR